MLQPLLIEIGVEELPAIPLLKELPNIANKWEKILEAYALTEQFEFYYTPRRLVLWHPSFPAKQDDTEEEFFGAPVEIAFKDGVATPAAQGFAKKCDVSIDEIGRAHKGGKEVLYFKKACIGNESAGLISQMIHEFLQALSFGKSMRWGSNSEGFIRPVRWLGVMFGETVIAAEYLNVVSKNITYVHRQSSFEPQTYTNPKAYFEILKAGNVELFAEARREKILAQFKEIEAKEKLHIEIDGDLLEEVVAITEHPVSLVGSFSETFLELPDEVIITSMREHQRYFPVYKEGKLSNHFIVVSNAVSKDYSLIVSGNEKVLHARLSDALFFYQNDLKRGLVNNGLEKVVYMNGLGSLKEKLDREKHIALALFNQFQVVISKELGKEPAQIEKLFNRLFEVSKADLMSEMVYEFTELQGVMGYYYANKLGEDALVATAIKEQYLPDGEDSDMPSNDFSALIALAVKLDALMGLFSIDQIPTGSRDPFALRRAATGIIRIALDRGLALDLSTLFSSLTDHYKAFEIEKLQNFFIERLYPLYEANISIIKAVIASGESNVLELDAKIKAVAAIAETSLFKDLMSIFKRVANITKDMTLDAPKTINETLFIEDAEKTLYQAFKAVQSQSFESYDDQLDALFQLAQPLEGFFDSVMVNAEDEALKNNRKNLIGNIYLAFKAIADIKEITL